MEVDLLSPPPPAIEAGSQNQDNVATPEARKTDVPGKKQITSCPIYREVGKGLTWDIDINVPALEMAFIDAWGFDERSGSVFVIITGPYEGTHTIHDGAFCGGIPVTANYEPVKQQRMGYLQAGYQTVYLPPQSAP